jgi:transcriptional regulator with XRE-family HTH domain
VKDLLLLLGKRIHELRVARAWSQEEFAHVSGLHRTYIGQIERGEKNISFGNLVKVSAVLGVTASELLSVLEGGSGTAAEMKGKPSGPGNHGKSGRRADELRSC